MTKSKLALVVGVLALITILGVVSVGAAFAQTGTTPSTPVAPNQNQQNNGMLGKGFGFGFRGGNMATFDAVAKALNLDPTELFNQLHSGKSLSDIATAQGKTMADVQAALNASRVQAMKDKIQQALTNGTITQDEATWLQQGLDKGYFGAGKGFGFGLGFGGRGHGGRGMMPGLRNFGNGSNGTQQQPTPSTSGLGSSS
jgi:hypothetical protein